jgi:hypothetical protein
VVRVGEEAGLRVRKRVTNNEGNKDGMRSLSPGTLGIEIIRHSRYFVKKSSGALQTSIEFVRGYSRSRCTVSMENAGRHTAMYSAPPSCGVE